MPRAHHAGAAGRRIERDAHRCHEGTRAENTSEIVVHRLHDFRRLVVLDRPVMKKKFCQRGEERGRSPVSRCVRYPK